MDAPFVSVSRTPFHVVVSRTALPLVVRPTVEGGTINLHSASMAAQVAPMREVVVTRTPGTRTVFVGGATLSETDQMSTLLSLVEFEADTPSSGKTTFYKAWAAAGSAQSAAVWRIRKIVIDDESGSFDTASFADGDVKFDNVWDDRKTTVVYPNG